MTNPPFGTKKGGGRPSYPISPRHPETNNLAFVEHIVRALKLQEAAAVVVHVVSS